MPTERQLDILLESELEFKRPRNNNDTAFKVEITTLPFVEIIELLKKSLNAKYFFTTYATGVKSWNKKLSGKNSNGNRVEFSEADTKEIIEGFKRYSNDFLSAKDIKPLTPRTS